VAAAMQGCRQGWQCSNLLSKWMPEVMGLFNSGAQSCNERNYGCESEGEVE
jgi:hypothetical protein